MSIDFENNDIEDIKHKRPPEEQARDVDEMFVDGDEVWARTTYTNLKPDTKREAVVFSSTGPRTYDYTVQLAGTYIIEAWGGGGGSASLAWSDSSYWYGGAAVASGGQGAYTLSYVNLKVGDKLTITVGGRGADASRTVIGSSGKFNLTGGNGGSTGIILHTIERVAVKRLKRFPWYQYEERAVNYYLANAAGGTGGKCGVTLESNGNYLRNVFCTSGAGGGPGTISGGRTRVKTVINGATASSLLEYDSGIPDVPTKYDLIAQPLGSGDYGLGSGGHAVKYRSSEGGYLLATPMNRGGAGAIIVTYGSKYYNSGYWYNGSVSRSLNPRSIVDWEIPDN